MTKRFAISLLALTLAALPGLPAIAGMAKPTADIEAPTSLRTAVSVDGPQIKLGDLFDGVEENADRPILQAPAPGQKITLEAVMLYRIARAYGLSWRPFSKHDRAVIERSGQRIEPDQTEAAIREALVAKGADPEIQVAASRSDLSIILPAGADPQLEVEDVSYDERNRRFSCTLVAAAGTGDALRRRITGRVFPTTQIPVFSHAVKKGDVVTVRDLDWLRVRTDDVKGDTVRDADALVGMAAARFLRENSPVRLSDVNKPVLVAKGALVTIVLKSPTMSLSAQGKALEEGFKQATIRVQNTISSKTILATVVDENVVVVQTAGAIAALDH